MRPFLYYTKISVSYPKEEDYTTTYFYKKGVMVGIKVGPYEEDYIPPSDCVEEKILDEVSYNLHLNHYQSEVLRLQNEFRRDLIEKYGMSNHPKANKIFDTAWNLGISYGYPEIEEYFISLLDLFKEDTSDLSAEILN